MFSDASDNFQHFMGVRTISKKKCFDFSFSFTKMTHFDFT